MSRDRDLKFGTQVHRAIPQKSAKKSAEKGRGLGHVTLINFGVPPNISTKRVELVTSNLEHRCRVAISQKPAKKNPEKGRGLGHVTPKFLEYTLTYLQSEWR